MIWTASGEQLKLERFPYPGSREHRAWDASDELLFENPAFLTWSTKSATGIERSTKSETGREPSTDRAAGFTRSTRGTAEVGQNAGDATGLRNILMFDDDHGSLALAAAGFLAGVRIWLVSDSLLTHRAVLHNDPGDGRGERIIPVPLPQAFSSQDDAASYPAYPFESVEFHAVIMKLPKSAAMFEIYCDLVRLRAPGSPLWIGGMSKRWSPAVRSLEESIFGRGTPEKFRRRGRWVHHPAAEQANLAASVAGDGAGDGSGGGAGAATEKITEKITEKTAEQNTRPAKREYRFNSRLYGQSAGIYSSAGADAGSVLLLSALLSHYQAPPWEGTGYREHGGGGLGGGPMRSARQDRSGADHSKSVHSGTDHPLQAQPSGADLGCGNGILGIEFQLVHREWEMIFCDESYSSVESARDNWYRLCGSGSGDGAGVGAGVRAGAGVEAEAAVGAGAGVEAETGVGAGPQARFMCMPALEQISDGTLDLVICNPPFHYKSIQTQEVARHMFQDAHRCLRPGSELWVVANSHLGYAGFLGSLFSQTTVEQESDGFKIYRCIK